MIIYIAGPMSGHPDYNHPAFIKMAERLRKVGAQVICPAELHPADSLLPWSWYLRRDLEQLLKCDHVVMLRGWDSSEGARLERTTALALGMTITYET